MFYFRNVAHGLVLQLLDGLLDDLVLRYPKGALFIIILRSEYIIGFTRSESHIQARRTGMKSIGRLALTAILSTHISLSFL